MPKSINIYYRERRSMSKEIFEIDNNGDVIYHRRFLWFKKCYIVNDTEKQKQLVKLLEAKNTLLFATAPGRYWVTPIMFIFLLFGIPLYFALEYLFPYIPKFILIAIIFIVISIVFIWDYYHQIDKILDK